MPPAADLPRLLADHAGFLRAVARRLVRDGHAADDLVQEAFVRALQHGGAPVGSLRGWLATIVRNVFRDERAAALARERRERDCAAAAAAAGGAGAGTADPFGVEQLEAALRALPPPYRHVLQARFYAQQSPAQIAATLAVPLATVRTRLQRALDLLRADLLARCGGKRGMRGALAPLTGWPAATTSPLVGVVGIVMTNKLVAAAAAVLVVAVAWSGVGRTGAAAPPPPAAPMPGDRLAAGGAAERPSGAGGAEDAGAGRTTAAGTQRVAVPGAVALAPIRGRVVYAATGQGVPFLAVEVRHGDRRDAATSDREGHFEFAEPWPADAELGVPGLLRAPAAATGPAPSPATPSTSGMAPAGGEPLPGVQPLPVDGSGSLAVQPRSLGTSNAPGAVAWRRLDVLGARDLQVDLPPTWLVRLTPPARSAGSAPGVTFCDRRDGIATWWSAYAGLEPLQRCAGSDLWWCRCAVAVDGSPADMVVASDDGLWFGTVPVPRTTGVVGPIEVEMRAHGAVGGTVRDRFGAPVAGAHVLANVVLGDRVARVGASSDTRGEFLLAHVPPGSATLRVAGERFVANAASAEVLAGRVTACDLTVTARAVGGDVTGTVTTASGARTPCAVWLTSRADDSIWRTADLQWTQGPGGMRASFRFRDVPAVECDVTLHAYRPCVLDTPRHRCTAPAAGLTFHVDDGVPLQTVRFARSGQVASPEWLLVVEGAAWQRQATPGADGAVEIALPVGQRVRWRATGPGQRARAGELAVTAGASTVPVPVEAGFSMRVAVMDIANFSTPAGVVVFADGAAAGSTDATGSVWLDLPSPPRTLALDPARWRVYHDSAHRSDVDPATGAWQATDGATGMYIERTR